SAFSFRAPATPRIYPLSLHDALPICSLVEHRLEQRLEIELGQVWSLVLDGGAQDFFGRGDAFENLLDAGEPQALHAAADHLGLQDRKSTRLNSSHVKSSYAVFCLKKK